MRHEQRDFMSKKTTKIYLCRDKDCRKYSEAVKHIHKEVSEDIEIRSVRCQKICSPQVVGVRINDDLVWVKKVKNRKDVKAIKLWLEQGKCPNRLKSRRVKKRRNKLKK